MSTFAHVEAVLASASTQQLANASSSAHQHAVNRKKCNASSSSESDDDDDAWALELEEELGLSASTTTQQSTSATKRKRDDSDSDDDTSSQQLSQDTMALQLAQAPAISAASTLPCGVASDLPHEVLVLVMSYGQVGRVCKSWSLAMSTLARRTFSTRLNTILQPFTPDATAVACAVEAALFEAYGQRFALPKSYGQKARQLLFNLKDIRNAALRDRLLSTALSPHALVRLSARDMANPQLVRQRKEWIKKRTFEVMRTARELDGFMETDLFECRSCGSSRTRYRQYRRKAIVDRTRIIVLCLSCPFSWEL